MRDYRRKSHISKMSFNDISPFGFRDAPLGLKLTSRYLLHTGTQAPLRISRLADCPRHFSCHPLPSQIQIWRWWVRVNADALILAARLVELEAGRLGKRLNAMLPPQHSSPPPTGCPVEYRTAGQRSLVCSATCTSASFGNRLQTRIWVCMTAGLMPRHGGDGLLTERTARGATPSKTIYRIARNPVIIENR